MAACVRDPAAKKKAQDDVKDMDDALKRVQKASKTVLEATAAHDEPARQAALKALREAVEDAMDAMEDFENVSRAPVVSLIQKTLKDTDKLTEASKKKDKDAIKNESLALADSAAGVIFSIRDEASRCPDPVRKKALDKGANDVDQALAEVLKAARAVHDGKGSPEDEAKAAAKLKAALNAADRLVNPLQGGKDRPSLSRFACTSRSDPEQQSLSEASRAATACLGHADLTAKKLEDDPEAFRKEAERVADELDRIAESIKMSPEEKAAYDAQKLAKDMTGLAGAVGEGDDDSIEEFLLECNEDQQSLVDGIKAVASMCKDDCKEDVERKKRLQADIVSLEKIKTDMAKVAHAKPGEFDALEAVRCAAAARVVLRDVEDLTCPEAGIELAALDKAVVQDLQELEAAVAKDDSEAARVAAKKLDKDVGELAKAADLIARRDTVVDPAKAERIKELARSVDGTAEDVRQAAKAWDKSRKAGDAAGAAEAKNRCGKKAAILRKDVKELCAALDEPYREAIAKESQILNNLANAAAVKHDAKETVAVMHDLVEQTKKLQAVPKPANADRAKQDEAIRHLNELLPKAAAATKACLTAPSAEADKALQDVVYDMQNELLAMKAAGDKGSEKGRAEDAVVSARKNLSKFIRAVAAKDMKAQESAKSAMKSDIEMLEKLLNDPKSAFNDGKNADRAEVVDAIESLKKLSRDMEKNAEQMKAPLDVLARNLDAPRDETGDTKKRIRGAAIQARKGACNLKRRNLDDLIKAGKNLAGALHSFGDTARVAAASGPGNKRSDAALALDDLLCQMELGGPLPDMAKVERLMKTAALVEEAPPPKVEKSFAAAVAQVATEIKAAVEVHKNEILSIPGLDASPLAVFLQKLADAARNNQRQEMLVSARGVSGCIVTFCKELTACAKRCKDPVYQDKLYSSVAALKNFGTQVKILTSVKAASSIDESDSDDQIVSVIRSLGRTTTDAFASIETVNKAKLLK